MSGQELIPFGKYKGQPVEVLQSDPQYVDWLMQQDWVRERYPSVMNIIINNFGEPEETPEHNRLQAMFLDESIRAQLANLLLFKCADRFFRLNYCKCPKLPNDPFAGSIAKISQPIFEHCGIDCQYEIRGQVVNILHGYNVPKERQWNKKFGAWEGEEFEVRYTEQTIQTAPFCAVIECKPSIGDDYPAILRQILSLRPKGDNPVMVLVYEKFASSAITEDQFRKFFECSRVFVFQINEILQAKKEIGKKDLLLFLLDSKLIDEDKEIIKQILATSTNEDGQHAT